MATWDEWFAYLDGRLDVSLGGMVPEIHEFIRGPRDHRSELGLEPRGPRVRVSQELCTTVLFLDCLVESAAESHHRAASLLYSQGRQAAWLPAALPNSEESRVVKRVVARRNKLLAGGGGSL
jgi:hypothetical protein